MRTEFSDNKAKYKRGGVHRRLRESNSLSNLSTASIRIESNSNRILGYVDATQEDVVRMFNSIEDACSTLAGVLEDSDILGFICEAAVSTEDSF